MTRTALKKKKFTLAVTDSRKNRGPFFLKAQRNIFPLTSVSTGTYRKVEVSSDLDVIILAFMPRNMQV